MKTLIPLLFDLETDGRVIASTPDGFSPAVDVYGATYEEAIRKAQIIALRATADALEAEAKTSIPQLLGVKAGAGYPTKVNAFAGDVLQTTITVNGQTKVIPADGTPVSFDPAPPAPLKKAEGEVDPELEAFKAKVAQLRAQYLEVMTKIPGETKTAKDTRCGHETGSTKGVRSPAARKQWIDRVSFMIEKAASPGQPQVPASEAYNADV